MDEPHRQPGVPEARLDPVLKRYPLRRHRIPVGSRSLSVVVPDDREWLRRGSWAPDVVRGREPPYWIRIWPVAVALARQLARCQTLGGLRVLDLGCGLGAPGVQAAALGASVCFVDREPDALAFAAWNAGSQRGCSVAPETAQVDWFRQTVEGAFDLILLSDVSYHQNHHRPLQQVIANALAPGGLVLHTDPMREVSTVFLDEMSKHFELARACRRTSFGDRSVDARIVMACASRQHLARWRARFEPQSHERASFVGVAAGAEHTSA